MFGDEFCELGSGAMWYSLEGKSILRYSGADFVSAQVSFRVSALRSAPASTAHQVT